MDRKINQIYDALECGNSKQALSLCTQYLKRDPDCQLVKALRAVALEKCGRSDEALSLCAELQAINLTDEDVIFSVGSVYKAQRTWNRLINLFEQATKNPVLSNSEELFHQLMLAHVRAGDLRAMHQVCVRLLKTFPLKADKYLFWTAVALLVQAQLGATDDVSGRDLSLLLAEKMIAKAIADKKVESGEQVLLYLMLLERQGRLREAVICLEGPLGSLLKADDEKQRLLLSFLMQLSEYKAAYTLAKKLALNSTEDWHAVQVCCDAASALKKLLAEKQDAIEDLESDLRAFLASLQQKDSPADAALQKPKRAALLAELELQRRKLIADGPQVATVLRYVDVFGGKPCCFDDLVGYLPDFACSPVSVQSILQACEAALPSLEADTKHPMDAVQRHVTFEKIRRALGSPIADLQRPLRLYKLAAAVLPATERIVGDELLIVGCVDRLTQFNVSGDQHLILESMVLLEYGLANSKTNFRIKLMLLKLCLSLGHYVRALQLFSSLEIKQIQWDTLGYLATTVCVASALSAAEAKRLFCRALEIYRSNDVETPDMILFALQQGTYSKIPEFFEFRTRLATSMQRAVATVEGWRLELLGLYERPLEARKFLSSVDLAQFDGPLSDQRDQTVLGDFECISFSMASRESLSAEILVLKGLHALLNEQNTTKWLDLCGLCVQSPKLVLLRAIITGNHSEVISYLNDCAQRISTQLAPKTAFLGGHLVTQTMIFLESITIVCLGLPPGAFLSASEKCRSALSSVTALLQPRLASTQSGLPRDDFLSLIEEMEEIFLATSWSAFRDEESRLVAQLVNMLNARHQFINSLVSRQ